MPRPLYADTATPAHAVKVGDRLRERRTGEVREVREIAATLTERRIILDDGTHIDCMFLDTLFVTTAGVLGEPTTREHTDACDAWADMNGSGCTCHVGGGGA